VSIFSKSPSFEERGKTRFMVPELVLEPLGIPGNFCLVFVISVPKTFP